VLSGSESGKNLNTAEVPSSIFQGGYIALSLCELFLEPGLVSIDESFALISANEAMMFLL
jgi:hypothetical protein